MSFNKRVQVRRKRFGRFWQAYGYATKVISMARQTDIGIVKGDIVSKHITDEKRLKAIKIKDIYNYGRPPILVYTYEIDGVEHVTEAKGWKRTDIRTFDFRTSLANNPKLRWKGEWKINEKQLFYPVEPYLGVV